MHKGFIDPISLVLRVHLGHRRRPRAGMCGLRVGSFPGTALKGLSVKRLGVGVSCLFGVVQSHLHPRIWRDWSVNTRLHHGGGDAYDLDRFFLTKNGPRQRVWLVRIFFRLVAEAKPIYHRTFSTLIVQAGT